MATNKLYRLTLKRPWERDESRFEGTKVVGGIKRYEGGMTLGDVKESEKRELINQRCYAEEDFSEVPVGVGKPTGSASAAASTPSSN